MKDIETETAHRPEHMRLATEAPICPERQGIDPVVTAYVEAKARLTADLEWCVRTDADTPAELQGGAWGALLRLADAVPETRQGLALKVLAGFAIFGELAEDGIPLDAGSYENIGHLNDDAGKRWLRSLLEGVHALAEKEAEA